MRKPIENKFDKIASLNKWLIKKDFFKNFKKELIEKIKVYLLSNIDILIFTKNKRERESINEFLSYNLTNFILDINCIKDFINKQNYIVNKSLSKVNSPMEIGFWVKKGFGINDSIFKIKSQRSLNIEYWLYRGFTYEASIIKVKEVQTVNANKYSKKQKLNPNRYKDIKPNQIGYWLKKGLSNTEAKLKVKERQTTFTLDKCISKLGLEKGLERYNERQRKWKANVYNKNTCMSKGYSKLSNNFIDEIDKQLIKIDMLYKDNEMFLYNKILNKFYYFDCTITSLKKIIEINGDFWHMNPLKYEPTDINKVNKKKAVDIWKFDKIKISFAKENGYDVLVVWESEIKENRKEMINKCLKFINNEN